MAKSGPGNTNIKGALARNTVNNSGGSAGGSKMQRPIPGPVHPGDTISDRRAEVIKNVDPARRSPRRVL